MKIIYSFLILCFALNTLSQPALPCTNNVYCSPNPPPQDFLDNNTRSVVKLFIYDGGTSGTATLLRQDFSDDNEQENIIITARHVIHQGNSGFGPLLDLTNVDVIFNYSSPGCANIAYEGRYKLKTKLTLIDESLLWDIAVLKIESPIPPHYKPYYSGWTATPFATYSGGDFYDFSLPAADMKKISHAISANISLINIPTRYDVFWTDGRTQKGSSGSGLLNFNRRLIGVLSGGTPASTETCFNTQFANFGKFRSFWLGNSVTRNKLNPNNIFGLIGNSGGEIECYSGDLFLDGLYWPAADYQPSNLITIKCDGNMYLAHSNKTLRIISGSEFNFEAGGNVITALPGFTAESGSNVTIKSNMACTAMRTANQIDKTDIDSNSVNYYYDEKKGELPKEEINNTESISTLELFPNPSKGCFKIKSLVYTTDPFDFELIDVNGRVLYSVTSNYLENGEFEDFQFKELASGVYMLKIHNEYTKKTEYKRVIIQK
ncbi:MAG: T9SS type A sorting domain-containing protein [Bacteroidota bacterium]|nr:T9SS type A sorting domain-containing protein [Bacteroidota bacterium]